MHSTLKPIHAQADRRRRTAARWWLGCGLAGSLLAMGFGLLPLQTAQAQGNPAVIIQQLQARVASLSQMVQNLNRQLTTERQQRKRQQQQMTALTQRLQRLQRAVNAAAAAGDPLAKAARSSRTQTALEKLAVQFETRARSARKVSPAASAEEVGPADLSGARLSGAVLQRAKLAGANLQGADLRTADLTNAVLQGASLRGAKLQGATLTGADLTRADLGQVLYDEHTRWPEGFDPEKHGALLVR